MLTYRCLVLLVYLDRLVCLSCDQPAAAVVKCCGKYPSLAVQGPWLSYRLLFLKVVTCFPIPEVYCAVISYGEFDSTKWLLDTVTNQLTRAPHPG